MKHKYLRILSFVITFSLGLVLLAVLPDVDAKSLFAKGPLSLISSAVLMPGNPDRGPHQDHNPKHGGIFFMCLDNKHHLEGVLLPSGTFRVYLYDDHTKPLKAAQVKEASGTVQIGESNGAPKITLGPGKQQETLEADLGKGMKIPVTLTVMIHLPGMPPHARPELFTFKFSKFTDENNTGGCVPKTKMQGKCP